MAFFVLDICFRDDFPQNPLECDDLGFPLRMFNLSVGTFAFRNVSTHRLAKVHDVRTHEARGALRVISLASVAESTCGISRSAPVVVFLVSTVVKSRFPLT